MAAATQTGTPATPRIDRRRIGPAAAWPGRQDRAESGPLHLGRRSEGKDHRRHEKSPLREPQRRYPITLNPCSLVYFPSRVMVGLIHDPGMFSRTTSTAFGHGPRQSVASITFSTRSPVKGDVLR